MAEEVSLLDISYIKDFWTYSTVCTCKYRKKMI